MKSNEDFHSNEFDDEEVEPVFKTCPDCDGEKRIKDDDNFIDSDDYSTCEKCKGEGEVEVDYERAREIRWAEKNEKEHDDFENYD
ncbi:MAG: hypothetical protein ACRC37_01640 [Lentisphaeria bacterium]